MFETIEFYFLKKVKNHLIINIEIGGKGGLASSLELFCLGL